MIGIIIQARINSKRLPKKILMNLGDKPLLKFILDRLKSLEYKADIVVATTNNVKDDIVEAFCMSNNIKCFRGSEDNVLERYYKCAASYQYDHIVRLTADNPFIDIEELDNLIKLHLGSDADYSYSFELLPVGVGLEIFSFETLKNSYIEAKKANHLEHVNEYVLENTSLFNISKLVTPEDKNRPDIRLTIDTEEDYKKACYIVKHSTGKAITTNEAIKLAENYTYEGIN